jgi:hypothetical protein
MNLRTSSTVVLTALACAVAAQAQTSQTTGAIRGTVKDHKSAVIANVKVTIRNLETGFLRTTLTDAQGAYHIGLLPVGDYEATVTSATYQTAKSNRLRVGLGESVNLNFTLDVKDAGAEVTVVAQAAAVDAQQVNSSSSITPDMVSSVPLNGRNFTDLVQLTPGAVANSQGYRTAVDGNRGVQNNLMIDGASFNSQFSGEQRGGTRIPFSFGLDSIRELQVITNAYDCQFGNASGGIINAVTKTGTNEFTGMLATQIRPSSFVANEKPVPYDPNGVINTPLSLQRKFSQQEYAGNVGGPIIKDVLHYFVNVDYIHASTQSVPAVSPIAGGSTAGAYSTFFGPGGLGNLSFANNGATLGQETTTPWSDDQKHWTLLARLDWTINTENHASLRMNSQQYSGLNDIYSGVRQSNRAASGESTMKFNSTSWVAELESALGPYVINDARIQLATESRPTTPNSTLPSIGMPSFYAGGYYIDPRRTDETTRQVLDTATYVNGDWTIKAGIDWQWLHFRNQYYPDARGELDFGTWDMANYWYNGIAPATTSSITYYQDYSALHGISDFGEKLFATFVQGAYNGFMDKRLTLSAGLRYTREMWGGNPVRNPALQGLDQMPDNGSLDPRFGFALDVFGNNRTVIRGGFGLFSNPNNAQNVASSFMNNGINLLAYKVTYSANPMLFTGGTLSASNLIQNGQMISLSPADLAGLPTTTVVASVIDPRAKETQAHRGSLEWEQDLGKGYVFKVKGTYSRTYHLQYWENINLTQGNASTQVAFPGSYYNDGYVPNQNYFYASASKGTHSGRAVVNGRTLDLSAFGDVYLSKYDGIGEYKNISFELNKVSSTGFAFNSSITLSQSRDSNSNENATAGSLSGSPVDPSNPLRLYRSDNDTPLRIVLTGKLPPYYGVFISGTFTWTSGLPWSPAYYNDINQDNLYNDYALGGRNSMRQPYSKVFNLALTRAFSLGRDTRLDVSAQVFNVFNWANQTVTSAGQGDLTYSNAPGQPPTAAFGLINGLDQRSRELQFNVKWTF